MLNKDESDESYEYYKNLSLKDMIKNGFKVIKRMLILIFIIILFETVVPLSGNYVVLSSFANQLYKCEMPEDTIILEKDKDTGNYQLSGSYSGYFAIMLIESDLSEEELSEYFKSKKFVTPRDRKLQLNKADIEVGKVESGIITPNIINGREYKFSSIDKDSEMSNLYYVAIYDCYDTVFTLFPILYM